MQWHRQESPMQWDRIKFFFHGQEKNIIVFKLPAMHCGCMAFGHHYLLLRALLICWRICLFSSRGSLIYLALLVFFFCEKKCRTGHGPIKYGAIPGCPFCLLFFPLSILLLLYGMM